ncbi:hypothetical protein [Bacillus sp. Marseille-Q3570]|uniref:hypothetical protein n=1 Tax=Bacillus sp. Marseille-Q3570 TaxID=2963522 RepID=UPI0021B7A025|nr:hypothetical protein [Bacillus sp. Marseille-Q3570]
MSEEKLDKLLSVMLGMKDDLSDLGKGVGGLRKDFEDFRKETNEKLDKIESNIDLLASKTWNNEKDINRLKTLMGIK